MLIPQRPYFTQYLPVLTFLVFAICCSAQMPHADREGRQMLPSPAHGHKVSSADSQTQREEKIPHSIHTAKRSSGLLKSAVSSSLIITTQTGRPGGQTDP